MYILSLVSERVVVQGFGTDFFLTFSFLRSRPRRPVYYYHRVRSLYLPFPREMRWSTTLILPLSSNNLGKQPASSPN
jgi:hypothetical protein